MASEAGREEAGQEGLGGGWWRRWRWFEEEQPVADAREPHVLASWPPQRKVGVGGVAQASRGQRVLMTALRNNAVRAVRHLRSGRQWLRPADEGAGGGPVCAAAASRDFDWVMSCTISSTVGRT